MNNLKEAATRELLKAYIYQVFNFDLTTKMTEQTTKKTQHYLIMQVGGFQQSNKRRQYLFSAEEGDNTL